MDTNIEQQITHTEDQQATFDEQRTTAFEDTHITQAIDNIPTMNNYLMTEDLYTSKNILETPVIIDTILWSTTDLIGATLGTYQIPDVFATIPNFHDLLLRTYTAFKPTIELSFKLNSTPFHQGRVLAYYNPMSQVKSASVPLGSADKMETRQLISQMPSVFLDASLANSGTIQIPFEFLKAYFNTNSDSGLAPMGDVNIIVFNPLLTAPSVPATVTIQCMLKCTELELHLPIYPHDVIFSQGIESREALGLFDSAKKVGGNVVSGLKSGRDAFANFTTGNFSGAFTNAGKTLGSIGSIFDTFHLDKPAKLDVNTVNTLHPIGPLNHMRGEDTSLRLGASPIGGYLTHNLFSSTSGDEHKISNIIKIKAFQDEFIWNTSQPEGTVLARFNVAPWAFHLTPLILNGTPPESSWLGWSFPFVGYICRMFSFWRGSIAYRFDVISSKMHSGRLAFIFIPNDDITDQGDPATVDLKLYSNCPIEYFDVAEKKSIDLVVPFVSPTPLKKIPFASQQADLPPSLEDYQTGRLLMVVMNRLVAPSNTAQQVSINQFMGGGSDMEFEAPCILNAMGLASTVTLPAPPGERVAMSSDSPVPTRSEDLESQNFIVKGGSTVANLDSFGESLKDIRDLMRRYTFLAYARLPIAEVPGTTGFYGGSVKFPITPALSLNYSGAETFTGLSTSFHTYLSRLYAFWHGSMRYKIVPFVNRTVNTQLAVEFQYGDNHDATEFLSNPSYPTALTNLSQQSALEVETPYYSYYTQLSTLPSDTDPVWNDKEQFEGSLLLSVFSDKLTDFTTVGSVSALTATVFSSIGDDMAFSLLVAPPQLWIAEL